MSIKPLKIKAQDEGRRLDKVLAEILEGATFGAVQKLCRKGQIRLNGKRVKGNERVEKGQEVRVPPALLSGKAQQDDGSVEKAPKRGWDLSGADEKLLKKSCIHEDDDIVVVNKPYGLPVQAGSGHSKSLDRMMVSFFEKQGKEAPKLLHRLDKTTTGVVVLAKTRDVAARLSRLFQTRHVQKTYWAVVTGRIKNPEGVINTDIQKVGDTTGYESMRTVSEHGGADVVKNLSNAKGQKAETHYKVIDSAGIYHWLEVTPKTGRTHQIRLHLASIGLPIVGDIKYNGKRIRSEEEGIPNGKIFLHAREIAFKDEKLGKHTFVAELPHHFKKLFELVDWKA